MLDILIIVFLLIIILLGCYNIKKEKFKNNDSKNEKKTLDKLNIPLITVQSQNRGALIKWEGDTQADAYIVLLSETTKPENGTTLQLTADPHCSDCEHALVNLNSNNNYTVQIRGFKNKDGGILSAYSNKVHFTPVQTIGYVKPIKSLDINTNYKKCD